MSKIQYFIGILIFAVVLGTTGCKETDNLKVQVDNQLEKFIGHRPFKTTVVAPVKLTREQRRLNIQGEFIRELFEVVLERKITDEAEFLQYMNVLDQGGHYEGLYNGLIYSGEYRVREKGTAPVGVVKIYAELMAKLVLDQRYDPQKIKPPKKPDVPSLKEPKKPEPKQEEFDALAAEFRDEALLKPTYSLKKRLGEEILKTIELKLAFKEKFASWYGKYSVFLLKYKVDFGLKPRNRDQEYFHYKWALEANPDRVRWECLNKAHRILNYYNK